MHCLNWELYNVVRICVHLFYVYQHINETCTTIYMQYKMLHRLDAFVYIRYATTYSKISFSEIFNEFQKLEVFLPHTHNTYIPKEKQWKKKTMTMFILCVVCSARKLTMFSVLDFPFIFQRMLFVSCGTCCFVL